MIKIYIPTINRTLNSGVKEKKHKNNRELREIL